MYCSPRARTRDQFLGKEIRKRNLNIQGVVRHLDFVTLDGQTPASVSPLDQTFSLAAGVGGWGCVREQRIQGIEVEIKDMLEEAHMV